MRIETVEQSDGSVQVMVDSKPLTCTVCAGRLYHEYNFLLNTRGGEFFGLAWAEDKASNFVCTQCGYIFWFLSKAIERTKLDSPSEPVLDRIFGRGPVR